MAVSFNTFPTGSVARTTAVDQKAVKYGNSVGNIPRRLLVFGSPTDGKDLAFNIPKRVFSQAESLIYGQGSQLERMLNTAFSYNPNIEIFACPIKVDTGTPSKATIQYTGTAAGSGDIIFYIGGQRISVRVLVNDTPSIIAINTVNKIMDNINLPCTAEINKTDVAQVDLKAKWSGTSSNQLKLIKHDEPTLNPSGILATIKSFTDGEGDLILKDSFENFGDTWFTMMSLPVSDKNNLDEIKTLSDKLISAVECRAFQYVIGKSSTRETYRDFVESRNDEHLTAMFVENALSPDYIISASAATYMENAHTQSPNASYSSALKSITPAFETKTTEFGEKDAIVKLGGCTTEVRVDGLAYIENTVTTYKKNATGAGDDSWRYPQVMAAYQEVSFQTKTRFMLYPYDRAVVVDDDSIASSPYAVRPLQVKATMRDLIASWESNAVIRDVSTSLETVACEIDKNNASRINYSVILFFALPLEQKAFIFNWSTETVS